MIKQQSLLYILSFLVVIAVLLGSCSPVPRQPCPEPGDKIPAAGPGEDYVTFTIQNDMCMSVCQILVSPNRCEYMGGVDWVKDHPLRVGESISQEVPPGKYAVWVELCSEEFRADEKY